MHEINSYDEALAYLNSFINYEKKPADQFSAEMMAVDRPVRLLAAGEMPGLIQEDDAGRDGQPRVAGQVQLDGRGIGPLPPRPARTEPDISLIVQRVSLLRSSRRF